MEVTDYFVPLQRERWINLQRPRLIPAKLNAWLFYLNDIFRKMLACLLALCTIVSCSQDAEDVLVGNYYAVSKGQNYHVCAIKQF